MAFDELISRCDGLNRFDQCAVLKYNTLTEGCYLYFTLIKINFLRCLNESNYN